MLMEYMVDVGRGVGVGGRCYNADAGAGASLVGFFEDSL
jgi:hypothetical protein